MIFFVDFEASSLGRHGFPIELAWCDGTGAGESHLIRPAPEWTEWSTEAAAIHGIAWAELDRNGEPHTEVACRALDRLAGQTCYASAPSWDGQWMSRLLRAAGLPRHAIRLLDTDLAHADAAIAAPDAERARVIAEAHAAVAAEGPPRHRALPDAMREWRLWREVARRAAAA